MTIERGSTIVPRCLFLLLVVPIQSATPSETVTLFWEAEADGLVIPEKWHEEFPGRRSIAVINGIQETITCTARTEDTGSVDINISFKGLENARTSESDVVQFERNGKKYFKKSITMEIVEDIDEDCIFCIADGKGIPLFFFVYDLHVNDLQGNVSLNRTKNRNDKEYREKNLANLNQRIVEKVRTKFQASDLVIEDIGNITGNARSKIREHLSDQTQSIWDFCGGMIVGMIITGFFCVYYRNNLDQWLQSGKEFLQPCYRWLQRRTRNSEETLPQTDTNNSPSETNFGGPRSQPEKRSKKNKKD